MPSELYDLLRYEKIWPCLAGTCTHTDPERCLRNIRKFARRIANA